jgi:hypothetical protein
MMITLPPTISALMLLLGTWKLSGPSASVVTFEAGMGDVYARITPDEFWNATRHCAFGIPEPEGFSAHATQLEVVTPVWR